jgi:hypothetical protein
MKEERKEKKGRGLSIAVAALGLFILALLLFWLRASPPRVGPALAVPDLELAQRERGWAKRTAGLEALAAGDLDRAIAELTEAQALLGDPAEVSELLRVAQDWRARAAAKSSRAQTRRTEASSPPGGDKPPIAAAPPPIAAVPPLTAAPRVDVAQARSEKANPEPSAGDEDRAKAGAASTVATGDSAPSRGDRAEANAVAPALAPGPARPPGLSAGVVSPSPSPSPEPEPEEVDPGKGGLDVTSPGLYAEVWINGRSYGFPPIAARDLPAGVAEIVVRVNGDIVRTAKAAVVRDHVTALQMR